MIHSGSYRMSALQSKWRPIKKSRNKITERLPIDKIISNIRFKKPVKKEEKEKERDQETDGDTNHSFENDDGSLQSFGSITRILRKDKRALKRTLKRL